jgi:intracellular multiplication protein IcmK
MKMSRMTAQLLIATIISGLSPIMMAADAIVPNNNAAIFAQPASPETPTPPPFLQSSPQSAMPPPPITARGKRVLTFEQEQQVMLDSAPPSKIPPTPESKAAFDALLKQNIPLNPQQVVELHQEVDVSQRAAAVPANVPPKPVSTTIMVNLAPGTTPPAVRLAQGYVSAMMFVDSTGAPWPVAAFDIGNPKAVNIQWDGKSNIILIQAVSPYMTGDIVVRLVGLATPITLELVAGQRVVDYRVDLHVSGIGPNTKELPVGSALPSSANQLLLGILDGVAPSGSKLLTVRGGDAQAWMLGQTIYLRTRMTVLSPGWTGKMVSPDGMIAYELPRTSSVLISRYGEPVELKVEGL